MTAMHAPDLPASQPTDRPLALLRDPIDFGPLYESNGQLHAAGRGRAYRIMEAADSARVFDLFVDGRDRARSLRCDAPWDPERFDDHYEDIGYYETGEEYEAKTGIDPKLSRFHHSRVKDALLDWLTPASGHAVLDVGCGAGWFLERIWERYHAAGHAPRVVGLEASTMQARFTARRMARRGITNGCVARGNAERMPFADASFDLVTCSETLEQVEDPIRAVREMARVLKPGGQLLLSVPSRLGEATWDAALAPALGLVKKLRRSGPPESFGEYYAALYPEELEGHVRHAGLHPRELVQSGIIPHNHYFLQLPRPLVGPLVDAFEWVDRRFAASLPQLTAHVLLRADKPAAAAERTPFQDVG